MEQANLYVASTKVRNWPVSGGVMVQAEQREPDGLEHAVDPATDLVVCRQLTPSLARLHPFPNWP